MNRWLAILILSFGTAILVAHAAIPHHHHGGVTCYHHDEEASPPEEASHSHGPAHPLDFNCSLKQLYLMPAGNRQITPSTFQVKKTISSQMGLPVVIDVKLFPGSIPLKLLSNPKLQDFPDPAILHSGSRAPPLS